jgi:GGDEF domain-containing protein
MRRCVEDVRFGLEDGSLAKFTVSIGVTQTNDQTRTLNELISWGESALNAAKQKGGNRVELDARAASPEELEDPAAG